MRAQQELVSIPASPQLADTFPTTLDKFATSTDALARIEEELGAIIKASQVTHLEKLFLSMLVTKAKALRDGTEEDELVAYSQYIDSIVDRANTGLNKPTSDERSGCLGLVLRPFQALFRSRLNSQAELPAPQVKKKGEGEDSGK